ncbi:MAG: rhamnulokinase [Armatimonadetes bacterium]|nr:rhamnulokinase [Armatimonadota bacterium]HOM80540.1 rhamnulokinase family protein [Armatimonadota bacterium]HPO71415.1 rhamnulokinase family protein [Armatimonadota bacterium]
MAETAKFLAIDLGAESGRGVVGLFDGSKLRLEEVHRFPNGPVRVLDSLHWDALRLFSEMKAALAKCVQEHGSDLQSVGVDTWGVDFGLLGKGDVLLGNPYHYRDKRTDGMLEEAFRRVPREEIFERTGIQFMKLNTLYQLLAMRVEGSPLLDMAERLLFMPDLFHFFLTGNKVTEFSIATTSQMYDPRARGWATGMLQAMEIPTGILGEVVPPGTEVGTLLPSIGAETGGAGVPVITPAAHDTGSAVAAVPARGADWCYISSGTWSLMGIESPEPLIDERSLRYNFTNEGGVGGTIRFLKNIMGLWLVQECRRAWLREGNDFSYAELTRLASQAPAFVSIVDPDDETFMAPDDMPDAICAFCRRTGQPEPETTGAVVRCCLESLALKYRWVVEKLEEIRGRRLETIHIVGGGSQNRLLNQFAADATGRPVVAGPVEATAIGSVLIQAIARGHLGSLAEAREVVRASFEVETFEPKPSPGWDEAYQRYLQVAAE